MAKTLLLADDSVTIQKVVGITFASEDIELVAVDNGDDALASARSVQPDLVLADVSMPGLNGYELCEAIKNDPVLQHTPVILLTGTFDALDSDLTRKAGADAQIAKPFEAQALVDLVHSLLEKPGEAGAQDSNEPPAASESPAPLETDFSFADMDFSSEADSVSTRVESPAAAPVVADPLPAPPELQESADGDKFDYSKTTVMDPAQVAALSAAPVAEPAIDDELQFNAASDPLGIPEEPLAMDGAVAAPLEVEPLPEAAPLEVEPLPEAAPLEAEPLPEAAPLEAEPLPEAAPLEAEPLPEATPLEAEPLPEAAPLEAEPLPEATPLEAEPLPEAAPLEVEPLPEAAPLEVEPLPEAAPLEAEPLPEATPLEAEPLLELASHEPALDANRDEAPDLNYAEAEFAPDDPPSQVFGDPLAPGEETTPELSSAPELATPTLEAAAPVGIDRLQVRDTIEAVAWEALEPLSKGLVAEVLRKVEEIVWEVVPQLAERLVREEMKRLTDPDD
jgi:CheY-like chemotaxis protein